MLGVIHWFVSVDTEKRIERGPQRSPYILEEVLHCERAALLLANGKFVFVVLSPPRCEAERRRAAFGV